MTKSTTAKRLAGTFRPDRQRSVHGVPALGAVPRMPADLPERAKTHWRRCGALAVALGTLTEYDVPLLELLARTLGSIDELEESVRRDGAIVESGAVKKAHPALQATDRARLLAHRLLGEFGLCPLSREKLSFDHRPDDTVNPFDEF